MFIVMVGKNLNQIRKPGNNITMIEHVGFLGLHLFRDKAGKQAK